MLPLDKISLTIVLKKVVYFADYKHITLPATQRNHLDPILCYHRPHADHFLRDRGATVKVVPLFVYGGVFIMGPDDWTYGKRKKVCLAAYLLLCS